MIGSRILAELVRRGHTVKAVVRNPDKIRTSGVKAVKGDMNDEASVAATVKDADAVISAYAPPQSDPDAIVPATRSLLAGLKKANVQRIIFVGGAGSLHIAPGIPVVNGPNFPAEYKGIALAHVKVLPVLKASGLDWTYLSPAAVIAPGERTAKFRLGGTDLLTDGKGESRISAEDYAIALVDELEHPKHARRQFTVAY
jgi:putative NADH-flavin reductase